MSDWKDPSEASPADGDLVEVRLPGGRRVKPVEFWAGRFWKFREGSTGHAYTVEAWRTIETGKKGKGDGSTESTNG